MKKLIFSSLVVAGLITLSCSLVFAKGLNSNTSNLSRAAYLNQSFNMVVADNNNNDKIDKSDALAIAEKFTNGLSKKATEVTVTHQLLTYDGISPDALSIAAKEADPKLKEKGGINKLPVWIVSYEGLNILSKGGNNSVLT